MKSLDEYNIDESLTAPKYDQLKNILLDYIANLPEEIEYLPYEHEIEKSLGVSKRTVRRSLSELRDEGLIETVRKRGSKVIRNGEPKQEVSLGEFDSSMTGLTVGALVVEDTDAPGRPWQITEEVENLVAVEGGSVAVYNLREKVWQDQDKLLASLKERGIEWVLVYYHSAVDFKKIIEEIGKVGIKSVVFVQDLQSFSDVYPVLGSGVDHVVLNHLNSIKSTLENKFADADMVSFVTTDYDEGWSKVRYELCRSFAEERNIPFNLIISDISDLGEGTNADYDRVRVTAGEEGAEKLIPMLKDKNKPLCIAANDRIAVGVLSALKERGVSVPEDVQLVGYDNMQDIRSLNLSTFDFNAVATAEAIVELYQEFLKDKKRSLGISAGRMVYSKYISRSTS